MKWIDTNPYESEEVPCSLCNENIAFEDGFYSCTSKRCEQDYHRECYDMHMLPKMIADQEKLKNIS